MKSLTGSLLIASPALEDPNFFQTVTLIVQHDDEGAFGLVLNRLSDTSLGEVWSQVSETPCSRDVPVQVGGPVPGPLMAIHTNDSLADIPVIQGVCFSSQRESLDTLITTPADTPLRVFVGHAGWGPGQLESEMREGSWEVIPASSELVFEEASELWRKALKRRGRDTLASLLGIEELPDDPSSN